MATDAGLLARAKATGELYDKLKLAVGAFLVEFTAFESMYMEAAITILSTDGKLVSLVFELLDLEDRFKLLKRLAEARGVSAVLMQDLQSALSKARKLAAHRNEIAHNAAVVYPGGEPFAGVYLPKSKRKKPTAPVLTKEQMAALERTWMRSLEDIEGYTRETIELRRAMTGIIERLLHHTAAKPA
jgi:hypothetical protein